MASNTYLDKAFKYISSKFIEELIKNNELEDTNNDLSEKNQQIKSNCIK